MEMNIVKQIKNFLVKLFKKTTNVHKKDQDDGDFTLKQIAESYINYNKVCFFCPTEGFDGNFGDIPNELEKLGCKVLWLFGTVGAFSNSLHRNKFLIINDMARNIYGVDAIVTASVMDCLPDEPLKILHDHLSFAHFELEEKIEYLTGQNNLKIYKFDTMRELFNELSAFVAFVPFYDVVLTSSEHVTRITLKALHYLGYSSCSSFVKSLVKNRLNYSTIDHLVNTKKYRKSILVAQSGYCKLDASIKKYNNVNNNENVLVFAPTPNDISGNKEGDVWKNATTINSYGAELICALCKNFPSYKIIFKPYKEESHELVSSIKDRCSHFNNLEVSECGSKYWELYSRTKIIISDFSSTAYTFALGIGRPVVFFSPNESKLPKSLINGSYCKNRESVGLVATSVNEVIKSLFMIIENYSFYLSRVSVFRDSNFSKKGDSSAKAAKVIFNKLIQIDNKNHFNKNIEYINDCEFVNLCMGSYDC